MSLPVRAELANGPVTTSALGYTLDYNTLDNNKNPTDGLFLEFRQDYAGVGGDVTNLKSAFDGKYYSPLVSDIVGVLHVQGGILNQVGNNPIRMLDQFQMGPNLVRGFAPNGIGPRDLALVPFGGTGDALGGTKYWALRTNCNAVLVLPGSQTKGGNADVDLPGTSPAQTGEVRVPTNKTVGTCTDCR